MSAPTDQFAEIAARTQESVTTAVRTWADTMQSVADGFTGGRPSLPDARVVVDRYFDFAQQVLDNQRQIAKTVLSAGTQAAQAVTEQTARAAQSVTSHTVNAAEAATDKFGDVSRIVGEKSAANARAAKDAVKN